MAIKRTSLVEKQNVLNELRTNNMTLQELRFFSIYLSIINARDPNSRIVKFSLSDFQKIMDFGRININQLQNTTNSLLCKIISIPLDSGGYESFQLFKKCKVDKNENGEWYVEIDSHDEALPYLFEYKTRYFTYQLWNALRLKSSNQLRMYEILKQYQKIGERELTVDKLRSLIGISKNEYPQWERFRTRVLDVCQKALRENTDIKFTYDISKRGQRGKILAIKFMIEKNDDYVDQLTLDEFIDLQPEVDTIFDSEYKETNKDSDQEQETSFKNENLEFLSEACNSEFDEEQMQILYDYLVQLVSYNGSNVDTDRYNCLMWKYNELKRRAKREDLKPITDRFAYLKAILAFEVKNTGAE